MKKITWEKVKHEVNYGRELIDLDGFIHCSSIEKFWRVAPNFLDIEEPLVLLCIDTEKVNAEIKWEDGDDCGRAYPHVYGELNLDSIVDVVPFSIDLHGNFVLNEKLKQYLKK